MRKLSAAEWILMLVTSRERAQATVGDLYETSVSRGALWFWQAVLRTAFSQVALSLSAAPGRVAGVVLLGAWIDFCAGLLLAGFSGILFFVAAYAHIPVHSNALLWRLALALPVMAVSWALGRLSKGFAPGREIGVCLLYVIVAPLFGALIDQPRGVPLPAVLSMLLSEAALRTPALIGAVWARRPSKLA